MSANLSATVTRPEHEIAYQDICNLVRKHADTLTPLQLLAVAANMLGKLAALQDQRVVTSEIVMEVVTQNFTLGNQQVVAQLQDTKGNA